MVKMEEATLERNFELVRDNLIQHLDRSIDIISKIMNSEMSRGLNILLKPAFKVLHKFLIHGGIRRDGIKGIEEMISVAREIVESNIEPETDQFYEKVRSVNDQFSEMNQIGRLCKRNHKNFARCMEIAGELYEAQVIFTVHLLSTTGGNEDYNELCRRTFSDKADAIQLLQRQTNATKEILKVIEKDLSIINIPLSRRLAYRVLMKGYMEVVRGFHNEIDKIYGEY